MKYKKICNFIFIFMLLCFSFTPSFKVQAETIKDLKNALQKLEDDAKNVDSKIKYTEAQINKARNDVTQLYKDIDNLIAEMDATTKKIEELNVSIKNKDEETKELMSFIQISSSDSIYMDYIAGAQTMTEFIYRVSVSQQLLDYNNNMIKEMNQMIVESNEKKVLLKQQEEQSRQKQQQLYKNIEILGSTKAELYEYDLSLAEEIKLSRDVLDMYLKAGCKDNDDIKVCANKLLPPDTRFWRPLESGYVTSEIGWRIHPITGVRKYHDGIDLSNSNKEGTIVYAAANGKVSTVSYDASRGNYIVVHHNINGQKFTTTYLHLKSSSVRVKAGDNVTKNTALATMGTTGSSTGVHLHFSVATGLWLTDYSSYSTFVNKTVNPRSVVNFPAGTGYYNSWIDRTRKY